MTESARMVIVSSSCLKECNFPRLLPGGRSQLHIAILAEFLCKRCNIIEITPEMRYNPPSDAPFAAIASVEFLEIWRHKMLMRSIQSRLLHKNQINIICLNYGKKFIQNSNNEFNIHANKIKRPRLEFRRRSFILGFAIFFTNSAMVPTRGAV